ncbi:ABC transporter substrate-binding protein [Streptomyces sodiiphilus]|uniref:ABC transporter substrate-binding protein n=1 Tax=Streptomyces sodiiphilus TaxID=226217 RepID=A0ABN2NXL8_9ACTN
MPRRRLLTGAAGLLGAAALGGCRAREERGEPAGEYRKVVLAMPGWPGGQANAAVAGHLLERGWGVETQLRELSTAEAWDQLDSGSVHAILEDWGGEPQKEALYAGEKGSVVPAGALGVTGHVGWFVPRVWAERNPAVLHWENVNDFAGELRAGGTGRRGALLSGDPAHTTHDRALIEQLGLDLEIVHTGSESALIAAIREADRERAPLLAYFWQPHWLHTEVRLAEVRLPPYRAGCQDDPRTVACGYPHTRLPKYLNAGFAEAGGEAARFLREFSWGAEDQNAVAALIAGQGMSPRAAAEAWAEENPDRVAVWLPGPDRG